MFPQGRCERCMVCFELCGALAATASSRDSRAPLAETGDRLSFSILYITEEVFQLNSLKTNRQNKTQKKNIFFKTTQKLPKRLKNPKRSRRIMVLCVLQNQPMDLGNIPQPNQTSNRKRKRKPSGPKRRLVEPVDPVVEPLDFSPAKQVKVEADQNSSGEESPAENGRVPSFPDTASPTPAPGNFYSNINNQINSERKN